MLRVKDADVMFFTKLLTLIKSYESEPVSILLKYFTVASAKNKEIVC